MEATFNDLVNALVAHPTACMLAIALISLGWLFKLRTAEQEKFLTTILGQEAAHRETLSKVIPVAEKLTESVVILERVLSRKDT